MRSQAGLRVQVSFRTGEGYRRGSDAPCCLPPVAAMMGR
jgi:hypothetical protein